MDKKTCEFYIKIIFSIACFATEKSIVRTCWGKVSCRSFVNGRTIAQRQASTVEGSTILRAAGMHHNAMKEQHPGNEGRQYRTDTSTVTISYHRRGYSERAHLSLLRRRHRCGCGLSSIKCLIYDSLNFAAD